MLLSYKPSQWRHRDEIQMRYCSVNVLRAENRVIITDKSEWQQRRQRLREKNFSSSVQWNLELVKFKNWMDAEVPCTALFETT